MKLQTPELKITHIEESKIIMKDGIKCPESRMAWALFGPNQNKNIETTIKLGIIGDKQSISDFKYFVRRLQSKTNAKNDQSFLHVPFPGLDDLKIKIDTDKQATISSTELEKIEKASTIFDKISVAAEIIENKIKTFVDCEPTPHLMVLAYPKIMDDYCIKDVIGKKSMPKKTNDELKIERRSRENESLDNYMDTAPRVTQHRSLNLRALVKGMCMKYNIPIQIIRPSTLEPYNKEKPNREDDATVFWNIIFSMFYKANNIPWNIENIMDGTCYVGISFYKDRNNSKNMRSTLAQVFSLYEEGYVIKGNDVILDEKRTPHISGKNSSMLIKEVIDIYKKNNQGVPPKRLVIHKSSRFNQEEKEGFRSGAENVAMDLIAIGNSTAKLIRWGYHPPLRGTMIELPDNSVLLYTSGYVPFLGVYPGPHVPLPLVISEHHGETQMEIIGKEILALTRLNWNSGKFYAREPITLMFSRHIAKILKELPLNSQQIIGTKLKYYI